MSETSCSCGLGAVRRRRSCVPSRWTKAMLWKALPRNDGGCASCGAWRRMWRPHLAALVRSVDCLTRHQTMAGSRAHHLQCRGG